MTQAQSAIPVHPFSIVGAIIRRDPDRWDLFSQKYGRGLHFLVQRHCRNHADECFNAVVTACMEAVLNGGVLRDEDLPALIRSNFRRISLNYAEDIASDKVPSSNISESNNLLEQLTIFTPLQRAALYRFYVYKQDASSICHDLHLKADQFDFIRKVAKQAARLSIEISDAPIRKPSQPAFTTSDAIAALAG